MNNFVSNDWLFSAPSKLNKMLCWNSENGIKGNEVYKEDGFMLPSSCFCYIFLFIRIVYLYFSKKSFTIIVVSGLIVKTC